MSGDQTWARATYVDHPPLPEEPTPHASTCRTHLRPALALLPRLLELAPGKFERTTQLRVVILRLQEEAEGLGEEEGAEDGAGGPAAPKL